VTRISYTDETGATWWDFDGSLVEAPSEESAFVRIVTALEDGAARVSHFDQSRALVIRQDGTYVITRLP
jgi:hypothetical protein